MKYDVRSLAERKHLETQHPLLDWTRAFESARQSLKMIEIDYGTLEQIALASQSPSQFTVIVRLIYQYGKSYPHGKEVADFILDTVNESSFSLPDWLEAIEYFYHWLQKNQRKVDFLPMLKYLECCAAAPDAKEGGQTFSALVEDMLAVAGYEG